MSGLLRHGFAHLSPSSLNQFAGSPAAFLIERLFGVRSAGSCAMYRGTAAEHGVEAGLFDPALPVPECQAMALKEYDRLSALSVDPRRETERDAIAGLVETALAELRAYGIPDRPEDSRQHKVSLHLPEVPVPIIGFLDFVWSDHGMIVDLKTQLRLSSAISTAHARQGALYASATNYETRFCYTTPRKCAVYRLEEPATHLEGLRRIALTLDRFLDLSSDPLELARYLVPDLEAFWFRDAAVRAKAFEVWDL